MFRTSRPGDSVSSYPERIVLRRQEEGARLFGHKGHKNKLLLMKENQISQVKKFIAFLYVGRCKGLGSRKSFLWCVPQVSGASVQFPLGSRRQWLKSDDSRWQEFLPSWLPSELISLPLPAAAIAGDLAQMVKCLSAIQETRLRSPRWEDPLEKEMATHFQYSCLENPMDGGAW